MPGQLQPLDQKFPIVDTLGKPTLYFIQWAQQRQVDITAGITAEQAVQIITQYLADHQLQQGSGISISPSGNIADSPTIAAEVQAILDQITNVHGSVLFRGAAGWEALGPGAAGEVLTSGGPGADVAWAAGGGGGGGGALELIGSTTLAVAAPSVSFTGIPGTFKDLVLVTSTSNSTGTEVGQRARFNGDAAANYYGMSWNRYGIAAPSTQTSADFGGVSRSGQAPSPATTQIYNYSQTGKPRTALGDCTGNYPADIFRIFNDWRWANTVNPITDILLFLTAGNYEAGSTFNLYGRGGAGGGGGSGASILYAGTDVDLVTDPGAGGSDIVTVAVPAASVARTYVVNSFVAFFGAHAIDAVIALDGVLKHSTLRYSDGGDRTFYIHCGPVVITVPGDGAAHTISMRSADVGALGAITIADRWLTAQLVA